MKLFDLHCDTALSMYHRGLGFDNDKLHITSDRMAAFDEVCQTFAIFSSPRLSDDECYKTFFEAKAHLDKSLEEYKGKAKLTPILAIEDAKLLAGDISRVRVLADCGVRFMTLQWYGDTCIGGGFNTSNGLTDFGKEVVRECFRCGIVPDVSHASVETFYDVAKIADGRTFMATHSNSRALLDHPRNLTNEQFGIICESGGVVGVSVYAVHLTPDGKDCTVDSVCDHIIHYLSLGGENCTCLGCDLDGIDVAPEGIDGIDKLTRIAERLATRGVSDELIEKVFYTNGMKFIETAR